MTLLEALDEIRKLGSVRLEDGKLKLDFPDSIRPEQVSDALAALKANREAVIERVAAESEIAPFTNDDPEVWRLFPPKPGERGLEAFIRRMEAQRDWWKDHPTPAADSDAGLFKSCSLCRGPLGDQPGSGYFVPPDNLNRRLGKPANTLIEVMLCSACFARPDREAALERSLLDEN